MSVRRAPAVYVAHIAHANQHCASTGVPNPWLAERREQFLQAARPDTDQHEEACLKRLEVIEGTEELLKRRVTQLAGDLEKAHKKNESAFLQELKKLHVEVQNLAHLHKLEAANVKNIDNMRALLNIKDRKMYNEKRASNILQLESQQKVAEEKIAKLEGQISDQRQTILQDQARIRLLREAAEELPLGMREKLVTVFKQSMPQRSELPQRSEYSDDGKPPPGSPKRSPPPPRSAYEPYRE